MTLFWGNGTTGSIALTNIVLHRHPTFVYYWAQMSSFGGSRGEEVFKEECTFLEVLDRIQDSFACLTYEVVAYCMSTYPTYVE